MIVGYLGIVVPESKFYQGYFIKDELADRAAHVVRTFTGEFGGQDLPPFDDQVHRTIGMFQEMLGAEVTTKLHVPQEYVTLVGGLCATMVSAALGDTEYPEAVIGTMGYALRDIIKRDYFWVEGRQEKGGGTWTSVTPIYVSSVDEARKRLEALPVVRKIKRRLLASYVPEGQHRTH